MSQLLGVKILLQGLKAHKASGPDNIPTRFLKEAANELAPALGLVFTASLTQGCVPDNWKTADVNSGLVVLFDYGIFIIDHRK